MDNVLPMVHPGEAAARELYGADNVESVHEYRSAEGDLLYIVARCKKAPLVRGVALDQAGKWIAYDLPARRPLYRLAAITRSSPMEDIWIASDEPTADALTRLGILATVVPTRETDLAALSGRQIVFWPSFARGCYTAAKSAAKRLSGIARTIELVDMRIGPPDQWLEEHTNATESSIRALELVNWKLLKAPEKKAIVAKPAVKADPSSDDEEAPKPIEPKIERTARGGEMARIGSVTYILEKDGLWAREVRDGGGVSTLYLGAPIRVLAKTRDDHSEGWGRLVSWMDPDGRTHKIAIPISMAHGDSVDLFKDLSDQGLGLRSGPRVRNLLANYLICWPTDKRAFSASRVGWCQDAFVLPHRIVGNPTEEVVYQAAVAQRIGKIQAGTLESWQCEVAARCVGNTRLVFAIAASFAGTLLVPTGTLGGGFNLLGKTSRGKSNALKCAASVWGAWNDCAQEWRATDNGLESVAAQHNDMTLILDEVGLCDEKALGAAAYMLANGRGKIRMSKGLTVRAPASWRLLFLSAGEEGIADAMERVGRQAKGGQLLRLPNIPAMPGGEERGIVEELHGYPDSGRFIRALEAATGNNFGHAGIAWLERIIPNIDEVASRATALRDRWLDEHHPKGSDGGVSRVATRFAIVAAAGELASEYGITGWPLGEAWRATAACFKAWLEHDGPDGSRVTNSILATVRGVLERDANRFPTIDTKPEEIARIGLLYGFRRFNGVNGLEILVNTRTFEKELCSGSDPDTVKALLKERDWLAPGHGGRDKQNVRTPWADRQWYYVLTERALADPI